MELNDVVIAHVVDLGNDDFVEMESYKKSFSNNVMMVILTHQISTNENVI